MCMALSKPACSGLCIAGKDSSDNLGAIVGPAVGVPVGILLLVGLIMFIVIKRWVPVLWISIIWISITLYPMLEKHSYLNGMDE